MAREIFQPLRSRGLIVNFNIILGVDHFKYLGERRNLIFALKIETSNCISGDWVSAVMPHVDFFVLESEHQSGIWFDELDHDNSLATVVGCQILVALLSLICCNCQEISSRKTSLYH
jgi:hypothetical protein